MESTVHYAENLIFSLFNKGYRLSVINFMQPAFLSRSVIRKTKTGKVNPFILVKALAMNDYLFLQQCDVLVLALGARSVGIPHHGRLKYWVHQWRHDFLSIGDFSRFAGSCEPLVNAGLDSAVIKSGNFLARSTRMSKMQFFYASLRLNKRYS